MSYLVVMMFVMGLTTIFSLVILLMKIKFYSKGRCTKGVLKCRGKMILDVLVSGNLHFHSLLSYAHSLQ